MMETLGGKESTPCKSQYATNLFHAFKYTEEVEKATSLVDAAMARAASACMEEGTSPSSTETSSAASFPKEGINNSKYKGLKI